MAWTTAFNATFLLGYLAIERWAFPAGEGKVPPLLEAVNKNGLVFFLLVRPTFPSRQPKRLTDWPWVGESLNRSCERVNGDDVCVGRGRSRGLAGVYGGAECGGVGVEGCESWVVGLYLPSLNLRDRGISGPLTIDCSSPAHLQAQSRSSQVSNQWMYCVGRIFRS